MNFKLYSLVAKSWLGFLGLFLSLALTTVHASESLLPPQEIIKKTSDKLQDALEDLNYKVDFAKANRLVEAIIEPHVEFNRFAALVLGRHWRDATPEQKERFKEEFKTMLIRTYATAYGEYAEWSIRFLPLRMSPDDKKVMVRTEFLQPGSQPVEVNYRMIRKDGEWKVYDIMIGGVDLIQNYRTTFNDEIAKTGSLDSLIKRLEERNKQALQAQSKGPNPGESEGS